MIHLNTDSDCLNSTFCLSESHSSELNSSIKKAAVLFGDPSSEIIEGAKHLQFIENLDGMKFFGIRKECQNDVDFPYIKTIIFQKLALPANTPFVQIVGDSASFSKEGTDIAKTFLAEQLAEHPQALVCWGFTATKPSCPEVCDVNGLVNNWVSENATRYKRVLANIVDYGNNPVPSSEKIVDTSTVISEYQATYLKGNKNFYLVYDKAQFGDDIKSSDQLTDKAFCFEGGPQTWAQIVNFLSQNIKIVGLFNLRGEKNPSFYIKSSDTYGTFFSAVKFLHLMNQFIHLSHFRDRPINVETITNFKEEYFASHLLIHPDRHNASTKQPIFEAGWKKFINEKLWERLSNCALYSASEPKWTAP